MEFLVTRNPYILIES